LPPTPGQEEEIGALAPKVDTKGQSVAEMMAALKASQKKS
jgi:hypothetical protein